MILLVDTPHSECYHLKVVVHSKYHAPHGAFVCREVKFAIRQ